MTDGAVEKNLTERQKKLLAILIREYINDPEPVSSKVLTALSDMGLSSATIRNEMAVLEEAGFIRAPHTSAGRVPTEEGYRYFVKQLLEESTLPRPDEAAIQARFRNIPPEMEAWMQNAALVLAQQTHSAALVTEPRLRAPSRFKHVQLIGVQGRLVLMVLVLDGGNVHQQMLIMAEPIPQERLNHASEAINRVGADLPADKLREKTRALSNVLMQEVGELVAEALQQLSEERARVVYRAGLGNILPEFEDDAAQQAIQILEGQTRLDQIVDDIYAGQAEPSVRVIVGGEGRWEELSNLSMVLGRYATQHIIGTVGVVGPTRMHYGQAISTVSYIADFMSTFLQDVHSGDAALDTGDPDTRA